MGGGPLGGAGSWKRLRRREAGGRVDGRGGRGDGGEAAGQGDRTPTAAGGAVLGLAGAGVSRRGGWLRGLG